MVRIQKQRSVVIPLNAADNYQVYLVVNAAPSLHPSTITTVETHLTAPLNKGHLRITARNSGPKSCKTTLNKDHQQKYCSPCKGGAIYRPIIIGCPSTGLDQICFFFTHLAFLLNAFCFLYCTFYITPSHHTLSDNGCMEYMTRIDLDLYLPLYIYRFYIIISKTTCGSLHCGCVK